jgi:uncharacterized membrane protein
VHITRLARTLHQSPRQDQVESLQDEATPAVNRTTQLETKLQRWTEAGLIDAQSAGRILVFERGQERRASLRWPVILAMVFGGILFAAGITLFVAAHWIELSPAMRFSLVLLMVGILHVGGASLAERFPALSTTLHALGTATLGAAIFLSAQIFNLRENWATGILLWALGATFGYILLRDWPQAAFLSLLAPAWLISQWSITTGWHRGSGRPLAVGLILTALCYLSARIGDQENTARRTLVTVGAIVLLPCVGTAIALAMEEGYSYRYSEHPPLTFALLFVGWTIAVAVPFLLSWLQRRRAAWINVLWALWAYLLILSARHSHSYEGYLHRRDLMFTLALYALCAIGSVGLVAWGLYEKRKERVNLGVAAFALSVLFFYFDSFMDKLGRSASLLTLGILCLAGGYALEVTRRRLMARMETSQ